MQSMGVKRRRELAGDTAGELDGAGIGNRRLAMKIAKRDDQPASAARSDLIRC
jgi:hypothetical protein